MAGTCYQFSMPLRQARQMAVSMRPRVYQKYS
jgi:hypothetical protein